MGGETTNSSVGREMKVERNVSDKKIEKLNNMYGYKGVHVAGVAMEVTDGKNVEINDSDNNPNGSKDLGKKVLNPILIIGGKISKKFDQATIEDIEENGVSLKLKSKEKEKRKEEKGRKTESKGREDN